MTKTTPLILASASTRRLELLAQIGLSPDAVDPAEIDESALGGETAARSAVRLAIAKANVVAKRHSGAYVVAADTIVSVGGLVLGTPSVEADARAMLERLSGRGHRVLTGVAVIAPDGRRASRLAEARVRMGRFRGAALEEMIACGEWRGAAGGYRIQGRAGAHVAGLTGSYTAVVGLPLFETKNLLLGLGLRR